jgi:NAD+ synthase (glutamine-hydrolysing)
MRIALAQLNPVSGDIDGNTRALIRAVEEAAGRGAEIVVAPEMVIPGYCIGDLIEDRAFLEANELAMLCVARSARAVTVVAGFIDCDYSARSDTGTPRKYNAAAVVRDGHVLQRARKTLLPNYRYFDDKRFFTPAEEREPVDLTLPSGRARVGVSICEDMWDDFYDVKPLPELAAKGAGLLLNINASPFYPGKRHERDGLIRRHIQQIRKPVVYVNTAGAADNGKNIIPFDGESLAYDANGRLIAIGRQFAEDLLIVDLDGDGLYQPGSRRTPAAEPPPPIDLPPVERDRELYDALLMALGDYMRKTGFTRATVAVSGGIDSALALALAVDALGPEHVTAFNMPSKYNTETTRSIAERLAAACGVSYGVIPIQSINDEVISVFEDHAHPIARSLTRENLQARIRGLLMMAESNDTGALLISCGNETEIALGYATLYGDMCGGLSLIGDLSKTDVYRLARYANRRSGTERIPSEAFEIVPSAELAENQFDPFDYSVVAPIVGELVERRTSPQELVARFEHRELDRTRFLPDAQGRTVYDKHTAATFKRVVEDAAARMRRSVYKRLQGPPIVAVSERAFGFDLRETIINGWSGA